MIIPNQFIEVPYELELNGMVYLLLFIYLVTQIFVD